MQGTARRFGGTGTMGCGAQPESLETRQCRNSQGAWGNRYRGVQPEGLGVKAQRGTGGERDQRCRLQPEDGVGREEAQRGTAGGTREGHQGCDLNQGAFGGRSARSTPGARPAQPCAHKRGRDPAKGRRGRPLPTTPRTGPDWTPRRAAPRHATPRRAAPREAPGSAGLLPSSSPPPTPNPPTPPPAPRYEVSRSHRDHSRVSGTARPVPTAAGQQLRGRREEGREGRGTGGGGTPRPATPRPAWPRPSRPRPAWPRPGPGPAAAAPPPAALTPAAAAEALSHRLWSRLFPPREAEGGSGSLTHGRPTTTPTVPGVPGLRRGEREPVSYLSRRPLLPRSGASPHAPRCRCRLLPARRRADAARLLGAAAGVGGN